VVKQAVGTMSGGEKARLVLCMLVWQRPNLLLMDEPTNHLDLATREALGMALNEFEGTVMLVSHDRALLRAVCDEFWLVSHGGIAPFDGDLDDYQRYLLDEAKRQREAAKQLMKEGNLKPAPAKPEVPDVRVVAEAVAPVVLAAPVAKKPLKNDNKTRQMVKELAEKEQRMQALQAEVAALENQLGQSLPLDQVNTLSVQLQGVLADLQSTEERWLALSELLEAA
jgi:ATP-binding cassette subfamily F protein 3